MDESKFFPLQGYTDIEPGKSVMAHFSVNGGRQSIDKGERFSLAQEIAYRFADFDKDAATPDAEKLKTLHFGTFSFTGVRPLTPDVKSANHLRQGEVTPEITFNPARSLRPFSSARWRVA
jgi:hypothetical protein